MSGTVSTPRAREPDGMHRGTVITPASHQRCSSDALEIGCWNGEVVRVVFAIATCDREIIAWQASTGSVSGEMVRELMLAYTAHDKPDFVHSGLLSAVAQAWMVTRRRP